MSYTKTEKQVQCKSKSLRKHSKMGPLLVLMSIFTNPAASADKVRVDRDVNAVWNVWRTTAAARYGLKVRPSREEAQRTPDVILCPGVLVRGGRSLRVDREFDTGGV